MFLTSCSPPHRWLRKAHIFYITNIPGSPPHRWLRNSTKDF
ncbi:hypothetical protein BSPWISOX_2109 [uncultured Gammaproteobacteria bacterium]|nr:hypothetical protein BSPWISOX_2109 [uncultured Gammaproteobacteria bacterium]